MTSKTFWYIKAKLNKRDKYYLHRVSSKASALKQAKGIRAVGGYASVVKK